MSITIAHLYYDILNLYGESGNIKILKYALEKLGIKVIIKFVTVDDELDFNDYDMVYMGMGIPENFEIVINHLLKYKKDIKKFIKDKKVFLCTGNSYELFGKEIKLDKNTIKCLNIYEFTSKLLRERLVNEVSAKTKLFDDEVIGFINTTTFNNNKKNNFLKIKLDDKYVNEGIIDNNFIGTYTIGPLLARNPKILECIIRKLIKDDKFILNDINFLDEAYVDTLKRRENKK